MARPRAAKYKDLPEGLHFKECRGVYILKRVDGSTKSLGKNKNNAKKLAFTYNKTFRVDPELTVGIYHTKIESKQQKKRNSLLNLHLSDIFEQIAEDKRWAKSTLSQNSQRYVHVKDFFGNLTPNQITNDHITEFLGRVVTGDSKRLYNRYLTLLELTFDYCVDRSIMENNPAKKRIKKTINRKDESLIYRLTCDDFTNIHKLAGDKGYQWMQVAMELSIQTSHAVNEIAKMKYDDIENGYLKVQRQKNQKSSASRVKIPMNDELERIVEKSKSDGITSPYIVHKMRAWRDRNKPLSKSVTHETQLRNEQISRTFSDLRDELGLYNKVDKASRPSFHDIRALSIHWLEDNGYDAQKRAAHSERDSTDIYKRGHTQWNEVEDKIVDWRN